MALMKAVREDTTVTNQGEPHVGMSRRTFLRITGYYSGWSLHGGADERVGRLRVRTAVTRG